MEYLAVDGGNADFTKSPIPVVIDRLRRVMARVKEQEQLQRGSHDSDFSSAILYFFGAQEKILWGQVGCMNGWSG